MREEIAICICSASWILFEIAMAMDQERINCHDKAERTCLVCGWEVRERRQRTDDLSKRTV